MWFLCLPHLPCFPGHILYLHILQSARDQGQDFWRHLQGLWRTRSKHPLITPEDGAEQQISWQSSCPRSVTHPFFNSFMLKESLKEWAKKTVRTGTFFPSSIAAIFLFSPTCSPILPGLPALSQSDMGDLPFWKAPGTRNNNLIFPATNIRRTEKSWQYFYFPHVKLLFGVTILMHTVTIMYMNLITIFVVSWSDLLNESPALWVYSVCVCKVLHWNLASLPKAILLFPIQCALFFSLRKKGTKSHAYFFLLFYFLYRQTESILLLQFIYLYVTL